MAVKYFVLFLLTQISLCSSVTPIPCPRYEHFVENGNPCYPTCQGQLRKTYCTGCPSSRCYCDVGRIRDEISNRCILLEECPRKCLAGEVFDLCGTPCQETCTKTYEGCVEVCVPGCFCEKGKVRDDKTGKCIERYRCQKCALGEEYTCGNVGHGYCNKTKPRVYTGHCVCGCYCKKGLMKDEMSGKCVLPLHCPKKESSVQ